MGLGKRLARVTRGLSVSRVYLLLSAPAFWLFAFLLVPLFFVFVYGLSYYDDSYKIQLWPLDFSNYADAISIGSGAIVIPLLLRTFGIAALTTVVSLVVGYAMAYYIARLAKEKWRGPLMALVVVPFWVNFLVRIYAVFPFSNKESFIHTGLVGAGLGFLSDWIAWSFQLGEGRMVVFTLMYVWLPFMILPLFASLSKLDPLLLEAAYDLGASRWRAFFTVTLPLTFPAMMVGSILIFITSSGAFIEPEMVGGGSWLMIGNYVQTQFNLIGGLPAASASALFIILVTVLLISIYRKYAEIEQLGETEAESRIFRPILRLIRYLRAKWPAKAPPAPATMPDGNSPAAIVSAPVYRTGFAFRKPGWEKALDVVAEKGGKYILGGATLIMLLLFFVPLIIVAVFSFNNVDSLNHFRGFSLEWWIGSPAREGLFNEEASLKSIGYSILIAGLSSVLAVFFGLLAALAITRYTFRLRGSFRTLMYLGLVIPSLIMGVSLAILIYFLNFYVLAPLSLGYGLGAPAQWDFGLASVVVGHTTFNIPLATLVLMISLREFDRTLEEAAMNLGADEITTFLRVTLPNIMPGIISAVLLGFTFSFDELPVTLFLMGGDVITLPVLIYGLISKRVLTPRVNAAATLVLVLSLIFIILTLRVTKRSGQLFRI